MSAPLVTRFMCPHGGQIMTDPTFSVRAGGKPVMVVKDAPVAGCSAANPCVRVVFPVGSLRARSHGQPLLTAASVGHCLAVNGQPGGLAVAVETQALVIAS